MKMLNEDGMGVKHRSPHSFFGHCFVPLIPGNRKKNFYGRNYTCSVEGQSVCHRRPFPADIRLE